MSRRSEVTSGLHVLDKAQALVRALAKGEEGKTAAMLASEINEPISSVYRLLSSLTALRWVERGELRGEYRLGTRFIWLGDRFEAQLELRSVALPSLRTLNDVTAQTAFLCIRTENRATCIERVDGQDVQIQRLRLGGSLPLDDGATPRVLLAFADPDVVAAFVEASGRGGADRAHLLAQLAEIRERGHVVADDGMGTGIRSVGAPVFDHRGAIVAAISVSGLRARGIVDDDRTVALVVQEADRVSALLGHTRGSRDLTTSGV